MPQNFGFSSSLFRGFGSFLKKRSTKIKVLVNFVNFNTASKVSHCQIYYIYKILCSISTTHSIVLPLLYILFCEPVFFVFCRAARNYLMLKSLWRSITFQNYNRPPSCDCEKLLSKKEFKYSTTAAITEENENEQIRILSVNSKI